MTFPNFQRYKYFLKSVRSNVFAVSLSIDIIFRIASFSSNIVDLPNVLINFNLLKLRATVLLTTLIGKLSLWWPQPRAGLNESETPGKVVTARSSKRSTSAQLRSVLNAEQKKTSFQKSFWQKLTSEFENKRAWCHLAICLIKLGQAIWKTTVQLHILTSKWSNFWPSGMF